MNDIPEEILHLFARLKDRDLKLSGHVITEGRWLAERLLQSAWEPAAVLCTYAAADEWKEKASGRCSVYAASEKEISQIAGFPFHRGVLAAAKRPEIPPLSGYLKMNPEVRTVCAAVNSGDAENLGTLMRAAAALGTDVFAVTAAGADPYSRRSLRVSMGAAFSLPVVRIGDEAGGCGDSRGVLKDAGFSILAAVLDEKAAVLSSYSPPRKWVLLLGNEAEGLPSEWTDHADILLTIPMKRSTDSLNLGVAGGIFLHHLLSGMKKHTETPE